jgi:acyl-CoA synthetase (AMP-forming)/AMP-acid ligase II
LGEYGVETGDRVLLMLPNGVDYLAVYYGSLLRGAVVVAVQTSFTPTDLTHVVENCRPRLAVAEGTALDRLVASTALRWCEVAGLLGGGLYDGPPEGGGERIAQVIYTSGTMGTAKGVMLSHRALCANTTSIVEYLELTASDRIGVVLDFVYSYGNSLLLTHARVGGSLALLGRMSFPVRVVDLLGKRGCTGFSGVPSTFALLLEQHALDGQRLPNLRYVTCAGGALAEAHLRRLRGLLPHADITLMYGQTEASARLSYLPVSELDRRPRSIGRGIPGVALEVLRPDESPAAVGEEGEIVASGDNLMTGYWGDPQATKQVLRDGRLFTGDLAARDADGFLTITGRKSELVKTGAYRVHPREVEEALLELSGVYECAVAGVADPIWGEILVACFPEGGSHTLAEIRRHLRGRLPEYKWPRHVVSIETIPRTRSGKVRRRELSELAQRAIPTQSRQAASGGGIDA